MLRNRGGYKRGYRVVAEQKTLKCTRCDKRQKVAQFIVVNGSYNSWCRSCCRENSNKYNHMRREEARIAREALREEVIRECNTPI